MKHDVQEVLQAQIREREAFTSKIIDEKKQIAALKKDIAQIEKDIASSDIIAKI